MTSVIKELSATAKAENATEMIVCAAITHQKAMRGRILYPQHKSKCNICKGAEKYLAAIKEMDECLVI